MFYSRFPLFKKKVTVFAALYFNRHIYAYLLTFNICCKQDFVPLSTDCNNNLFVVKYCALYFSIYDCEDGKT